MSTILNAAPQANLQGINDRSRVAAAAPAESYPQFLPHIYLYCQKGDLSPQLVSGDNFNVAFGQGTLDPTKPYYNHASALAKLVLKAGGSAMVQRVVPADAPAPATLSVSLDLLATTIQKYQLNPDGTQVLDNSGYPIPDGAPVAGYIGKFIVGKVTDPTGKLGLAVVAPGSQTDVATTTQSQVYPLFEMQVPSQGADGNNQGFCISAPTTNTTPGANVNAAANMGAFIFNFRQVSRPAANLTGSTIAALSGDTRVPFVLKPNAVDSATSSKYSIGEVIIDAYQKIGQPGMLPIYGNFGAIHVYQANIDLVLGDIFTKEAAAGTYDAATDNKYMINLFGATTVDGTAYKSYELLGAAKGGTIFTDNAVVYAAGGGDGSMTLDNFDDLVKADLLSYGTSIYNFTNMAKWPQSWFVDSGFKIATKEAAANLLSVRKDIGVILSTQDVSVPQNSSSQDSSTAIALASALAVYPESQVNGTPVCRAAVVGQSGNLINDPYQGLLPLSLDVAYKMATYMGAGNGNWKSGLAFDKTPLNKSTLFTNVNATSKSSSAYANDWANNLVWAQDYDRSSIFFPAFQTVYPDDTSVLNSLITVAACIELEKVCFRVWRDLVGRSDLTQAQFIKESNRLIAEQVPSAKFDGRFVIKPNTYFTANDTKLGWKWSCDITIYANPMLTVGTFTINSDRMSALATAS